MIAFQTCARVHSILDIPLNTTAEEMKALLEDNFDVGEIEVKISNGYPKCNAYRWRVDWLTKAGKQPDVMINASKVMGVDVQDRNEITEGGLFYKKIPGEFLRVITKEPQVWYLRFDKECNPLHRNTLHSIFQKDLLKSL